MNKRSIGAAAAAIGLMAAACTSDPIETVAEADVPPSTIVASDGGSDESSEPTETTAAGTTAEETVGPSLELVTIEAANADVELVSYATSALGGARFSMDPAHYVYTPGDFIIVSVSDPAGPASWESASIGLITQDAGGAELKTVEDVLELSRDYSSAVVEPTGTAIELFGYQLEGYRITSDLGGEDLWLYGSERHGSPAMSIFGFYPNAEVFFAETPAGVLFAGRSEADSEESLDLIAPALGTLLATIELTGAGLDEPLPTGNFLQAAATSAEEPRGELDPDGPDPLDAPFVPVSAGTYQMANFGTTFTIDLAEDWFVQPNFPGIIALTVPNSGGPGDRDVVFVTGVSEVVPVAGGSIPIGDPVIIEDVQSFLDLSLPGVEVSGVEEVQLGGVTATRFDVTVDETADCTLNAPCGYAFLTDTGNLKATQATRVHRVWWIDDQPHGPSMIVAMAPPGDSFLDAATIAVSTITFP